MTKDAISLELEKREVLGKAVRQLRRDGTVPAVIHDHGKDSIHVQGDFVAMTKVWKQAGKHHTVDLTAGGKKYVALIKDAAFDPKKHVLTHIVFNAVNANETVSAEIPVHAKYDEGNESSPAERAGLIVLSQLETISIESVPSKLPNALYYNAEKLVEIGDHITVDDLDIPEGVKVTIEGTHSIATVFEPSALAAANDAAGGDAEPEDATEVESESGTDVVQEADDSSDSKKED
ncbi:MAG: 50S ribosomal protein L25 [Patescibacteria group bacterium]|nr:50S ribosomal protein L25 [Patescibacteria group bacterium]